MTWSDAARAAALAARRAHMKGKKSGQYVYAVPGKGYEMKTDWTTGKVVRQRVQRLILNTGAFNKSTSQQVGVRVTRYGRRKVAALKRMGK